MKDATKEAMKVLDWMAKNSMFVFTLLAIILVFVLALVKGIDILNELLGILGIHTGGNTGRAISAHFAASSDPNVDSSSVIRSVEGLPQIESGSEEFFNGPESSIKPDTPD